MPFHDATHEHRKHELCEGQPSFWEVDTVYHCPREKVMSSPLSR